MAADVGPGARGGEASTAGLSIAVELVTGRGRDGTVAAAPVGFSRPARRTRSPSSPRRSMSPTAAGPGPPADARPARRGGGELVSLAAGPAFPGTRDGRSRRLDLLRPGQSFAYVFDLGEDWTHLCTVTRAADTVPAPPRALRLVGDGGACPTSTAGPCRVSPARHAGDAARRRCSRACRRRCRPGDGPPDSHDRVAGVTRSWERVKRALRIAGSP